jgi:hypothetical protein
MVRWVGDSGWRGDVVVINVKFYWGGWWKNGGGSEGYYGDGVLGLGERGN